MKIFTSMVFLSLILISCTTFETRENPLLKKKQAEMDNAIYETIYSTSAQSLAKMEEPTIHKNFSYEHVVMAFGNIIHSTRESQNKWVEKMNRQIKSFSDGKVSLERIDPKMGFIHGPAIYFYLHHEDGRLKKFALTSTNPPFIFPRNQNIFEKK